MKAKAEAAKVEIEYYLAVKLRMVDEAEDEARKRRRRERIRRQFQRREMLGGEQLMMMYEEKALGKLRDVRSELQWVEWSNESEDEQESD